MKRILVLYRELAGYFVECLNHLCEKYDVEAVVVAYPVHADAPFHFKLSGKIQLIDRKEATLSTLKSLTNDDKFDLIFCGGWGDKEYLEALKSKKTTALLGFDNQWNGSLKHQMSALYGRIAIKPLFDYAFVPGEKQKKFAKHLGFSLDKIIRGAYSCDVPRFASVYEFRKKSSLNGPKKLIYAGRYAEEKFIQQLCSLMKQLRETGKTKWELHCVGKGPLWDQRIEADGIFHHGFMQPESLFEFMKNGDAFILPSTFEPWGVVVHEFAAAGYPMILSSAIGAAEKFLVNNENGYLFESGNVLELEKTLIALFEQSSENLNKMGEKSAVLAKQITPDTWAKSLYAIM
jgi:glycosyltransferase involved in cell wall biosynthesis